LKEVLQDKVVLDQMADTKAVKDVDALESFYKTLENDPDRATYGLKQITKSNQQQAIDVLMISDSLFRSQSVNERKTYVDLVQSVKEHGGVVLVFSSLHVSGAQLEGFTGIAATLRFPIRDLDDSDESSEEDDTVYIEKVPVEGTKDS